MNSALNSFMSLFFQRRYKRIQAYLKDPELYQYKMLAKILSQGYACEYAKKYTLGSGASYEEFAKKLPVVDYEDLGSYVSRMMRGERSVLWPGPIKRFSKSSGTTSDRSKYIPITKENLLENHLQGAWDAVTMLYHHKPNLQLFSGKNLLMGGSLENPPKFAGLQCGDISALMIKNTPWIAKPFFTPSFEIALLEDWNLKIEKMAETLLKKRDLVMLGGVPTWIVVLFKRLLEITGKNNILEIQPNIQAYLHGGVGMNPYLSQFKKFLPNEEIIYQNIYNASEGYFAAQGDFTSKDQEMLLLLNNGLFFEFAPMEGSRIMTDQTVPIWGVKKHQPYAFVITNNSGLWRYMPGDTLTFISLQPYQILLTGRTQQCINTFGEELMIGNAEQALKMVCQQLHCEVNNYTVAPVYLNSNQKGRHQWLIEFSQPPQNLTSFSKILDETLCALNSDYAAKRTGGLAMDTLTVETLPEGTFMAWLEKKGKLGGQNKIPRLSNERKFVEEILQMIH
jgi:hypothetical protein